MRAGATDRHGGIALRKRPEVQEGSVVDRAISTELCTSVDKPTDCDGGALTCSVLEPGCAEDCDPRHYHDEVDCSVMSLTGMYPSRRQHVICRGRSPSPGHRRGDPRHRESPQVVDPSQPSCESPVGRGTSRPMFSTSRSRSSRFVNSRVIRPFRLPTSMRTGASRRFESRLVRSTTCGS